MGCSFLPQRHAAPPPVASPSDVGLTSRPASAEMEVSLVRSILRSGFAQVQRMPIREHQTPNRAMMACLQDKASSYSSRRRITLYPG